MKKTKKEVPPWIWTETQFLTLLDKYLELRIDRLDKLCESLNKGHIKKKLKQSLSGYKHETFNNEYKRKCGCEALECDIEDWSSTSASPNTTLEELMLRAIASERYNVSLVCYSFLCTNPKITEEFIEQLMFVGSGLFDFNKSSDRYKDAVIYALDQGPKYEASKDETLVKLYGEDNLPRFLRDCIDWKEIALFNFSKKFNKKHEALFSNRL